MKKNRQDLNAALLDQFVSGIPGAVFEKSMTQLISEGEATAFVRKDNATQNLVIALMFLFLRFTNKQLYHLQSTAPRILLIYAAWKPQTQLFNFANRYHT